MFSLRFYNIKERKLDYKNIVQSFCIMVVALLFYSCEQDLNIEIKTNDKRLLVDGEFTNDTVVHSIRLNCSGSVITGKSQTIVSGAKIYVTDGIETFDYIENKDMLGLYQTPNNCFGIGGHIYTLNISHVDIDGDGKYEIYSTQTMMPVPVRFDSMASFYGMNGDRIEGTICNIGYYTTFYNGPDYYLDNVIINSKGLWTITNILGGGKLTRDEWEFKTKKVNTPESIAHGIEYFFIEPQMATVNKGDTIYIVGINFNKDQYKFLKEFDNNTNSGDLFSNNMYDQLKIPTNLPTNIEPADKAAGYFFIYSVSKISKIFNESLK